jgi:hypothetical protein
MYLYCYFNLGLVATSCSGDHQICCQANFTVLVLTFDQSSLAWFSGVWFCQKSKGKKALMCDICPILVTKGSQSLHQSDYALLTVTNFASVTTRKKVSNHSPWNKTHLPEINKPHARISGVEISMCYPIDSNTCIEITSGQLHSCKDFCQSLKITWFWDLTVLVCVEGSGHVVEGTSLAVPWTQSLVWEHLV